MLLNLIKRRLRISTLRLVRIFRHWFGLADGFEYAYVGYSAFAKAGFYLIEIFFLFIDFFGVFDFWYWLNRVFKRRSVRRLSPNEALVLTTEIPALDLQYLRIDEGSQRLTSGGQWTFVGGLFIKTSKKIDIATLVHEAVHLYQYQKYGAVYIPRCLAAQNSEVGYDFTKSAVNKWEELNWEQQAALVEDQFRMKNGLTTRFLEWSCEEEKYLAMIPPFRNAETG